MSLQLRMVLLALLIAGLVGFGVFVGSGEPDPVERSAATGAPAFHSSVQCAQCHRDVWNEWHGSHHQIAYLNPEVQVLSDNFRNKECQACHLPRPVAKTGYGRRTLHRTTLPDEGVSCLSCHLAADGGILARNSVPDAPCRPRASADLVSVGLCAACHNQHATTDQWRQTPFAISGQDCNSCHMPEVLRAGGRKGRGHVFAGSHDVEMLRRAVELTTRIDSPDLVVKVTNTGAGHNFPTEERSRAADVTVRFTGGEATADWQRVHRFRLPYRSEPLPDTTLPYGASKELRVAVPTGSRRAEVRLWYRLTPFAGDDHPRSALLFEQAFDWRDATVVAGPLTRPPLAEVSAFRPTADPVEIPTPAELPNAAGPMILRSGSGTASPPLPTLPALPPMRLVPRLDFLKQLAAGLPAPPDPARQLELRDLVATAFEPDLATRRTAAMARRSLLDADDAAWALEDALGHATPEVRMHATYELGQREEPASVVPLLLRLKYEVDSDAPVVIAWLADALAKLGNRAGLPYLIPLLYNRDVAEVAGLRAIEICRNAGVELSAAPTWDELAAGLRRLHSEWHKTGGTPVPDAELRSRIAAHLVALEDFQLRGVDEARFVLTRLGTAGVPLLREALRATEPYLRAHALEILRDLGPAGKAATPEVLPLLGDELTRSDAARALGRIRAIQAKPHLLALLRSQDLELRAAAAGALGYLGAKDVVEPLAEIFHDAGQPLDVRVRAAFSLALLNGDDGARGFLVGLEQKGGYHAPTLKELIEQIDAAR